MKVKNFIPMIILAAIFFSCESSSYGKLENIIEGSDKAEIFFYQGKEESIDDRSKIVTIEGNEKVKNFINFISEDQTPIYKCGYDGSMKFFKGGRPLIEMEFNLREDCRHFSFMLDDEIQSYVMTKEGARYLEELKLMPGNQNLILNSK